MKLTAYIIAALHIAGPAHAQTPKFSADVPESVITPDQVETRIGTLDFFDGMPSEETVQKVYDQLDLSRGVEPEIDICLGQFICRVRALTKIRPHPNTARTRTQPELAGKSRDLTQHWIIRRR